MIHQKKTRSVKQNFIQSIADCWCGYTAITMSFLDSLSSVLAASEAEAVKNVASILKEVEMPKLANWNKETDVDIKGLIGDKRYRLFFLEICTEKSKL